MVLDDYEKIALAKFSFLEKEYGFSIVERRMESYGCFIVYQKDSLQVSLGYENFEKQFFDYLRDKEKSIMFWQFFRKHDESINWPELMPLDGDYEKAIDKNILLLKKYGHGFLSGEEGT